MISSLPSVKGRCHPLVSTISHPRTMAVGCLHPQWSPSNVPRATVFLPDLRVGRTGMRGVIQSSHCHRQCDGRNWCMDHSHGERGSGIWHDSCARVRACQMSGWLRRRSNVLPTLSQVNDQRLLRQKRCYWLLDDMLCNRRRREGKGLDWIPDNCSKCRGVRCIFEQTVSYREWQIPLLYADDEPYTMWAWNPLSKNSHH